jgi:TP901 family phage tail tape measure protein
MAKSGAARVFFDIVGQFQAERMLGDTEAAMTVQKAMMMDALAGVEDSFSQTSQQIMQATEQVVNSFFEFEDQLVRLRKFYNDDASVMRFADATREMGEAFAFTGAEALAASARMAQLKDALGSQQAIIESTRAGLLMSQVGEMETEEGMNRFINLAQQTQFLLGGLSRAQYEALSAEEQANIVRQTSIHTLNQLNTIENSSVATMEDITFVLNQFASQADIAGESIGEMAAMSALLLETGEEVSRAGTGLRMIYQRLGNANNAATKAIAEHIEGVDAQGVAQMKLSDVLSELAPAYAEMSAEEKRALAVNIAGSRHYVKFLKLMENHNRLVQLQTNAFNAQYGAIEEFEKKMESTSFQAKVMEARLENLRVMIGEDLAGAYMTAYRAEGLFLKGFESIVNTSINGYQPISQLVGAFIGLSSVYEKTSKPLFELGINAFNLFIAFKTLQAVSPKQRLEIKKAAAAHRENAAMIQFERNQADLLADGQIYAARQQNFTTQGILNSIKARKASIEVQLQEERVMIHNTRRRAKRARAAVPMFPGKRAGKAKLDAFFDANRKAKTEEALLRRLRKSRDANKVSLQQLTLQERMYGQAQKANIANMQGRLVMEGRSGKQVMQNVQQQQMLNKTMMQQAQFMAQEVVLHQQLDASVVNNLNKRNLLLNTRQQELVATQASLQIQRGEMLSRGASTVAIDAEIANIQEKIATMGAERSAIATMIQANNTLIAAKKAAVVTDKGHVAQMKATTAAFFTQGKAMKAARGALMGYAMLIPMLVDEEHQMEAIIITTSVSMVGMLVPAITATNVKLSEMMTMSALATGGLTILIGGMTALAAHGLLQYGADSGMLDFLNTDIGTIEELNGALDDTAMRLADLAGPTGQGSVLAGMFDISYNELKQNADTAFQVQEDLATRIAEQKERISLAQMSPTTSADELAAMQTTLGLMEKAKTNVDAIATAHNVVSGHMREQNQIQGDIVDVYNQGLKGGIAAMSGTFIKEYALRYTDLQGKAHEEIFETEEKALERLVELNKIAKVETSQFTKDHYAELLRITDDGNASLISQDEEMYNTLLQKQDEFASAREELFFGERANFTGAIYKQIEQGKIENLLHKTEIVQSNHFHGYNTEEMVERVTVGVLDVLRAEGISV